MDSAPYFTTVDDTRCREFQCADSLTSVGHTSGPVYALTSDEPRETSHLAGLVRVANTAASQNESEHSATRESFGLELVLKKETKDTPKRKRSSDSVAHLDEEAIRSTNASSSLFRNVPTSGKKHTRPPMSKLFASLELSPEHFLQLQAVAKAYMLDDAFPERKETVGVRGKGDSEVVKLRLWNCVKDFLDSQGNGLKFFGPEVLGDEGGPRTMIWPQDKNKIISAVTPLLRRIITNERQRQYALETRSKGHTVVEKTPKNQGAGGDRDGLHGVLDWETMRDPVLEGTVFKDITHCDMNEYDGWKHYERSNQASRLIQLHSDTGLPNSEFNEILAIIDYHLKVTHAASVQDLVVCSRPCENAIIERIVDAGLWLSGSWLSPDTINLCDKSISVRIILHEIFAFVRVVLGHKAPFLDKPSLPTHSKPIIPAFQNRKGNDDSLNSTTNSKESVLILRLNLLKEGRRIAPRRDVPADLCPYIHTVMQKAAERPGPAVSDNPKVLVHLPDGLKRIEDDRSWRESIELARSIDWFDGELSVIVDI